MGRKLWQALAAAIFVLALGARAQAQTTTTTVTTTTTLATAVPTNDGYFYAATADLVLPSTKGSMLVYADTRGGSLTVTLPPVTCGCRVGIAKLYDVNLVHVAVADVAQEKAAPPPFLPVTTFDLDKAAGPVVFVTNAPSKTWFLGY